MTPEEKAQAAKEKTRCITLTYPEELFPNMIKAIHEAERASWQERERVLVGVIRELIPRAQNDVDSCAKGSGHEEFKRDDREMMRRARAAINQTAEGNEQ